MATPIYRQRPDHNVESATLQQSLASLTTAVSSDLPRIANRCAKEGLISAQQLEDAQLQTTTWMTNELLRRIIDQVRLHPRTFDVFLGILEESGLFPSVVSEVRKKYADNQEERKVNMHGINPPIFIPVVRLVLQLTLAAVFATICTCVLISQIISDVGDTHGISDTQVLEKQEQMQSRETSTQGMSELDKQEQPHAQSLEAQHRKAGLLRRGGVKLWRGGVILKRGGVILIGLIVLWVLPIIFAFSVPYLLTDTVHFSIHVSNTVKCSVFSLMCVIFFDRFHSRALLIAVAGTIVYCITTLLIIDAIVYYVDLYFRIIIYTCSTATAFACSYGLFYMCCKHLYLFYCTSICMFTILCVLYE